MKTNAMLVLAVTCLAVGCSSSPKKEASPSDTAQSVTVAESRSLSGDAVFQFGKAELNEAGRAQLDTLAGQLVPDSYELVRIVGHSDRIGNDKGNLALSTRRAQAVRDYLVERGIPDARIVATGRGAYEPVVQCNDKGRQALVDCLAPNRRVDITVDPPLAR